MIKIVITKKLKDNFRYIKKWSKIDDPDFGSKIYVSMQSKESILELEYVLGKNTVLYGSCSSMYDITEEELLNHAMHEGYKIVDIPSMINFKDIIIIIHKIMESTKYRVIPLEDKILVKSNESLEIEINGQIIRSRNEY